MPSDLPLEYKCCGTHLLHTMQTLLHHVIGTDKIKKAVISGDTQRHVSLQRCEIFPNSL